MMKKSELIFFLKSSGQVKTMNERIIGSNKVFNINTLITPLRLKNARYQSFFFTFYPFKKRDVK